MCGWVGGWVDDRGGSRMLKRGVLEGPEWVCAVEKLVL